MHLICFNKTTAISVLVKKRKSWLNEDADGLPSRNRVSARRSEVAASGLPLFLLWQKAHRFAKTRKRIKSKEKKEGKARLINFVGEEYIRLKAGTLLSAGLVPHFSVTGGNLGDRR